MAALAAPESPRSLAEDETVGRDAIALPRPIPGVESRLAGRLEVGSPVPVATHPIPGVIFHQRNHGGLEPGILALAKTTRS